MSDHDEFCHAKPTIDPRRCAECKQLAAVRADERERILEYAKTVESPLADLRAHVEALRDNAVEKERQAKTSGSPWVAYVNAYNHVLALMDGGSE